MKEGKSRFTGGCSLSSAICTCSSRALLAWLPPGISSFLSFTISWFSVLSTISFFGLLARQFYVAMFACVASEKTIDQARCDAPFRLLEAWRQLEPGKVDWWEYEREGSCNLTFVSDYFDIWHFQIPFLVIQTKYNILCDEMFRVISLMTFCLWPVREKPFFCSTLREMFWSSKVLPL